MKTTEQIEHDKNLRRVVVSSLVGAVIEWYDFFLYGVVAGLIFNHLYFPEFDDRIGTMLAFATFAVGFVARPLGGLVFGHFGDKIGRKKVLVLTLMIMGTGTVAIGCIPSYASIGIWAPILLILCRVAQGLGLGGEWGGAVLMSFESAPAHKRAFYASLPQVGLSLGLLLASGFARTVIFCAIAVGIIRALDIDPKSRLSSIIVIACFFAAAAPTMQFLHTSESFIWSFQVLMKAIGGNVDWWEYLNHACFINTIYVVLSFLTIYFMRGKVRLPEGGKLKLILEERLSEMGPMTVSEKRLLVLAILGILGFMVEPWTGVNAVYVLCLVALFCYMPGMKIMEPSSFNNLNIVFLVFVAGCMAIGFVAGEVGANKWAVSSIIPFLKELPPTLGVLCSYLAGVVTNLLLTPFAATVAFTPAFGELGVQMGVNPLPLFYAFEYGLDQYFFPYEGVMFLYIFTTGCVTLKHVIPTMIARCIVAGAFIAVIAIPYWTFIGIM